MKLLSINKKILCLIAGASICNYSKSTWANKDILTIVLVEQTKMLMLTKAAFIWWKIQ